MKLLKKMNLVGVAGWCAILSFAAASLFSQTAENIVKNPGFEEEGGWEVNNWAKNEVSGERVQDNPHSGKYCYRYAMDKVKGPPNVQLVQSFAVKPGQGFELRFWIRGKANSRPAKIQLRKAGTPYTSYWQIDVPIPERWTEYVYTAVLSDKVDPNDTKLFFELLEEGALIWIDDVSIRELPAKDPAPPLVGNQIANGSFEVGVDHWTARFRENGGGPNAGDIAVEKNINAFLTARPRKKRRAKCG